MPRDLGPSCARGGAMLCVGRRRQCAVLYVNAPQRSNTVAWMGDPWGICDGRTRAVAPVALHAVPQFVPGMWPADVQLAMLCPMLSTGLCAACAACCYMRCAAVLGPVCVRGRIAALKNAKWFARNTLSTSAAWRPFMDIQACAPNRVPVAWSPSPLPRLARRHA